MELQTRLCINELFHLVIILFGIYLFTGCAYQKPMLVEEPETKPKPYKVYETLLLQDEIIRLKKIVEKKDELIRKQHAHQKNQDKEQQEASSEVARVQTRLHRLATKPSTASTIAEAEVAMESLKQTHSSDANQALQQEAQRLLEAALVFYEQDEYVAAMNYASQAHEFINMVSDQNRSTPYTERKTVPFYAPIMLKTETNVNLRKKPHSNARILNTLKKDAILITNAYRGNWFRVQTDNGRQGWVLNTLVKAVAVNP